MGLGKLIKDKIEEFKENQIKKEEIRKAEHKAYYDERLKSAKDFAKVKVQAELKAEKEKLKSKENKGKSSSGSVMGLSYDNDKMDEILGVSSSKESDRKKKDIFNMDI